LNLKKIAIDHLQEGMISDQTICNDRGIILAVRGVSLTNSIITRLKNFDVAFIYIKDEDECIQDLSIVNQGEETLSAVKDLTDSIIDCRTVTIKDNIAAIEQIISSAMQRPFIKKFLAECVHDEVLYKHTLRTTILSINMGLAKEYNPLKLEHLAMCALMHDCGMERKFNEKDFQHPFLGFVKLRDNFDIDMLIAVVCLQHHEHYDGSGFPFSFNRGQISEFSSLLAVVDYYDRLLIKNNDPRKAMFQTIEKKNTYFHPNMIELFGSTIDWSRLYNIPQANFDKKLTGKLK
jgi:HD-GYP domain-containing protein (c-di-GMP phosphodiesterase class II)